MRAILAVITALFICGVINQAIGPHLPAQWGTIVGALVGGVLGVGLYRWLRRTV